MFREVVVFGLLTGLAVELYCDHEGYPHLPEDIQVPSQLLNAPTIVASGSPITPFSLPSGSPWGGM